MKILILTDLEGVSGINGKSAGLGCKIVNEAAAVQELADEVNACCEGLLEGGAKDIVVVDGHGSSSNLAISQLHPKAKLMQLGGMNPVCYVDSSYDAMIQIGAHSMVSSLSHMCHTFCSSSVVRMELNGKEIGEIGIAARIGGYFGVPTLLVSGDEAACREARNELGKHVLTVPTKQAWGRYTAVNYPPGKVCQDLRNQAKKAVSLLEDIPLPKQASHYKLILRLMSHDQIFGLIKTGGRPVGNETVEFESDDFIDVYAQRCGWAKGVHNRYYGINPKWIFRGI